MGKGS